jgi:PPM family protein phosphatase
MIRVEKTHLPIAALTHPGMKGKNNEDRFAVSAFRMKTKPATPVLLAILSDGIGGHRAGEVASELAVNVISQYSANSDGRNPPQILEEAITMASQSIFQQAQQNVDQAGMGATCACAWIAGDRLFTATVGDSRIYLMRGSEIVQLSTDHTWIQEALDRGLLQPDQVSGHPNAHVIRRYLGSPTAPEVDFRIRIDAGADSLNQGMRLLAKDRLLLCSDGLTDLVSNAEILAAFNNHVSLEEAGQKLIDLANQRGGHDNITVVIIEIPEISQKPASEMAPRAPTWSSRSVLIGCTVMIALAVVIGTVAGGWLLYTGNRLTRSTETPTATPVPSLTPLPSATQPSSPTPSQTWTKVPDQPEPSQTITTTLTALPSVQQILPTVTPIFIPTSTRGLPVVTLGPKP